VIAMRQLLPDDMRSSLPRQAPLEREVLIVGKWTNQVVAAIEAAEYGLAP
jgi:hypothetical protein